MPLATAKSRTAMSPAVETPVSASTLLALPARSVTISSKAPRPLAPRQPARFTTKSSQLPSSLDRCAEATLRLDVRSPQLLFRDGDIAARQQHCVFDRELRIVGPSRWCRRQLTEERRLWRSRAGSGGLTAGGLALGSSAGGLMTDAEGFCTSSLSVLPQPELNARKCREPSSTTRPRRVAPFRTLDSEEITVMNRPPPEVRCLVVNLGREGRYRTAQLRLRGVCV